MKRLIPILALFVFGIMTGGAGCSSDPNVEGAKLDLRNKDYDRALQNVETALSKNPNNADALEIKGRVLQEKAFTVADPQQHQQMVQEMLDAYNKAASINPALKADIDQRLRLAYWNEFQRGVQAFNKGRETKEEYANAAAYFVTASKIQPDSAGAYTNAGFALINAGRQPDAIGPFEQAIQRGEDQPDVYVLLSDIYMNNNRAGDAVTLLESGRQKYTDNQEVLAQLLNAYIKAGQMDRALASFGEAVRTDPNNKLYRYNYGTLLLQSNKYDDAIEQFTAAVSADPQYGLAHYNLGASYVNKAVDVNDRINKLDDELRTNRSKLSQAQIADLEKQIETLAAERKALFGRAVTPLEKAHEIGAAAGEDQTQICQALFTSYVQTGAQDKAQAISKCAGY